MKKVLPKYFVYQHIRNDKNTIFYIGIGKIRNDKLATTFIMQHYRAYSKYKRNPIWQHIVDKTSYTIDIIADNISLLEAKNIEIELIKKYGKIKNNTGLLSNISDGGDMIPDKLLTMQNDLKCSQIIYQYDANGFFIKEWPSTNEIKRELGFDNSVIRKAIKGKTKSPHNSYGYQWYLEYKGEQINTISCGKTTLHKPVTVYKEKEILHFNNRKECALHFKVKSSQVTLAIKNNWKLQGYIIKNKENEN